MKKHLLTLMSVVVGFLAVWLIFHSFPISWTEFSSFSPVYIVIWIIITLLIYLMHGLRWKIIMDANEIVIPLKNAFLYRIIGSSVSYFTPAAKLGGEPVRALLIKRHNYSLKNSLSSVVIDKAVELASAGIFFVIGVLILLVTITLPRDLQLMLTVAGALIVWVVFYYYNNMFRGNRVIVKVFRKLNLHNINRLKKYEKKLMDFEDVIIGFYKKNKKAFIVSVVISAVSWIFMFAEYKIAALIIGIDLSFFSIFLIFSFVGAAYMVPIPMSLGSLEAGQVGVFKMLKLSAAGGLAMSLLIRARDLLWGVIGLIILSIYGFNIRKTLQEDTRIDEEIERIK